MDFDSQQKLTPHLNSGERILSAGRPKTGLAFQSGDAVGLPFSIFWLGFSCFWIWGAHNSGAPLPFVLFGVPFVLMGLYLFIGRFFWDSWKRGRTYYGLTEERVMIVSGTSGQNINSVSLHTLQDISVSTKKNGTGTITLGPSAGMSSWMAPTAWPGSRVKLTPRFQMIPDVRNVYNQILRAQQELRR